MANMRGKNRFQANISFTLEEVAAAKELVKAGFAANRSDLIRRAFNDWREMKGYPPGNKKDGHRG